MSHGDGHGAQMCRNTEAGTGFRVTHECDHAAEAVKLAVARAVLQDGPGLADVLPEQESPRVLESARVEYAAGTDAPPPRA